MDNHFGGVIWTNHALDRLRQRGIKQGDAWATWNRPEQSRRNSTGKMNGAWVYYRTWGSQRIEVVAKQNEKKEWVILSVWSDPVFGLQSSSQQINQPNNKPRTFWRWLYNFIFTN